MNKYCEENIKLPHLMPNKNDKIISSGIAVEGKKEPEQRIKVGTYKYDYCEQELHDKIISLMESFALYVPLANPKIWYNIEVSDNDTGDLDIYLNIGTYKENIYKYIWIK